MVPNADEAATLDEIELPPGFDLGVRILALVIAAIGVACALFQPDDYRINAALVIATAVPWALALAGVMMHRLVFAAMVLLPSACLGAARWIGGVAQHDHAAESPNFGDHFAAFLILLMLLSCIIEPSTWQNAAALVGAYATVALQFLSLNDLFSVVVWTLAITLMPLAGIGLRVCILAVIDARDARAAQAAAEERRQIARDVHDVVAHTLAVTMLHMTAARMAMKRAAPDDAIEALEEAERHGRASLADVRRVIRLLRSDTESALDAAQPDLADLGDLVDRFRSAGLKVDLAVAGAADRVPAAAGLAVYRVAQEALANAARHGGGPTSVDLRIVDGEVALRVRNPVGSSRPTDGSGTGLLGIRERMAAAGGEVTVGPQNGSWIVDARIPLDDR